MSRLKNPFVAFNQLSNKCLLPKLSLAINEKPHYLQLFQNEKLQYYIFISNKRQPNLIILRIYMLHSYFFYLK